MLNFGKSQNSKHNNSRPTSSISHRRVKRFDVNTAAKAVAAVYSTGIRYGLRFENLYFDLFGNLPKEEKEAMQERINQLKKEVEKLEMMNSESRYLWRTFFSTSIDVYLKIYYHFLMCNSK